jgi:hypothetical protein
MESCLRQYEQKKEQCEQDLMERLCHYGNLDGGITMSSKELEKFASGVYAKKCDELDGKSFNDLFESPGSCLLTYFGLTSKEEDLLPWERLRYLCKRRRSGGNRPVLM